MIPLLAAEWIKLSNRWMPRILLLIQAVIVGLVLLGTGLAQGSGHADVEWPTGIFLGLFATGLSSVLIMSVMAGAWGGNEYSWGTIRLVLTARPSREQQYLSGACLLVSYVVLLLAVSIAEGMIAGGIAGPGSPGSVFWETLVKGFFAELLSMTFIALLAYTAGVVFRSPAAGIGTGIGLWIAENILRAIFFGAGGTLREISNHFPYVYANALTTRVLSAGFARGTSITASNDPGALPALIGVIVYVCILLVIGLVVTRSRDVTA